VCGSEDHSVYMWETNSKKVAQKLEGHTDVVLALDTHPTLPLLASGGMDKDPTVRVWSAER